MFEKSEGIFYLFIFFFLQLSPGPGVQVQAEHVQLCRFLQNINSFIKKTVGHLNISPTCCLLNISLQIYSHRSAAETEIILYLRLRTRLWSLLGCDPVHGLGADQSSTQDPVLILLCACRQSHIITGKGCFNRKRTFPKPTPQKLEAHHCLK